MIKTEEFFVNVGPQHPSTHGVLRLLLKLDGETIIDCEPHIGYLHRGIEKLAETRSYLQFIPFTDRLDYLAAMNNNLCYVQAVEKLTDIEVPERAEYIRAIMAELNRIASHLVWFGALAGDLGATTPIMYAFREREKIIELFEKTSGARLTYNYMRFGGVAADLPEGFCEEVLAFIEDLPKKITEYDNLLSKNKIFIERMKNIGCITKEEAINYGFSGPNLRATGYAFDIRKVEPYSVYDKFEFDIPTGEYGDCLDRYKVRMEEMRQSARIIKQAIENLPDGEIKAKTPRILRPKKGEVYHRIENPRGELGFYIISDGSDKPYRIKIRAPSFIVLQALPSLLKGYKVADVVAILGSIDIVLGEIDR